ncbi:MAG: hypothetical protein RL339_2598 [Pseudomonadota bacterium]|jgi:hypothetical protein
MPIHAAPVRLTANTRTAPGCTGQANRTGLPDRLKQGIEALSGFRLDHIRVHYNSPEPDRHEA